MAKSSKKKQPTRSENEKPEKKKEVIEVSNEMSLSDYLKLSDESYLNI